MVALMFLGVRMGLRISVTACSLLAAAADMQGDARKRAKEGLRPFFHARSDRRPRPRRGRPLAGPTCLRPRGVCMLTLSCCPHIHRCIANIVHTSSASLAAKTLVRFTRVISSHAGNVFAAVDHNGVIFVFDIDHNRYGVCSCIPVAG